MNSPISYDKIDFITKWITLLFIVLAFFFLYAWPEINFIGYGICMAIATVSIVIAVYYDIQFEKYQRLKRRGLGVLSVVLLTFAYFLFIA